MTRAGESFSIVVVGFMNPAIHHPVWYEMIGLLTENERQLALATPGLLMGPFVSQFAVGTLSFSCLAQRWHILTTEETEIPRIREIAKKTHDALTHTPVTAIGINFDFCRPSAVPNVSAFLAGEVQRLRVGVGGDVPVSGQVMFVRKRRVEATEVTTSVSIAPGPDASAPSTVLVKTNAELRVDQAVGRYDMAPLLDLHVPAVEAESRSQLDRTLEALGRENGRN